MTVQQLIAQQSPIHIGVEDQHDGMPIIELTMQYINVFQIQCIIYSLENMLYRFKNTAVPYYTIINDTVNEINISMEELEGNTVVCRLGANLIQANSNTLIEQMIGSLDENTMDVTIDMEIPLHAIDSPVLGPFIQRVNYRYIFSFRIETSTIPDWNQVLQDLELMTA